MKALVKTQKGVGFIEVRDMPEPTPGPGEVKIKIEACGICGSDIHIRHDQFPYWPPVILGHEFTGTVIECGAGIKAAKVGDRIVAEPHTRACGVCHLCRTGNIQICPHKRSPGWGIHGGMTQYICYPESLLHKIPDSMTWDQGAMVEPTANAVTDLIVRKAFTPGDFVVVVGPGPIGLLTAMVARASGAREVVLLGTPGDEELRMKKARELGFTKIVNVVTQNAAEVIQEMTHGVGADLVAECSGAPRAIAGTVDLVRKMGTVCAIGLTGNRPVEMPWDAFQKKVITLQFNMSTMYQSWDRTIALIASGAVQAEKVVTHKAPLSDWERVFNDIENLKALKGILTPEG
jgi:L-iditol 2-dehydrogenase